MKRSQLKMNGDKEGHRMLWVTLEEFELLEKILEKERRGLLEYY